MRVNEHSGPDKRERPVLWDPLNAWPAGRKWIWAVLATCALVLQGPSFFRSMRMTWQVGSDFFQDWASAQCP